MIRTTDALVPNFNGAMETVKRQLEGILNNRECSICKIQDWNGKPIVFELDHIDGDRYNNTVENLRYICANCHSQTSTFKHRNKKNKKTIQIKNL